MNESLRRMPADDMRVLLFWMTVMVIVLLLCILAGTIANLLTERAKLHEQRNLNQMTRDQMHVSSRINDDVRDKVGDLGGKVQELTKVVKEAKQVVRQVAMDSPSGHSIPAIVSPTEVPKPGG